MRILKWIGWIFILLGVVALGVGVWVWFGGHDPMLAAGQLWFNIDSPSLNTTQAVIQRYLHSEIWDRVFVPLLLRPAWQAIAIVAAVAFVIGVLLVLAGRPRQRYGFNR